MFKRKLRTLKKLVLRRPKSLIVLSFIACFLVCMVVETVRARMYMQQVEDYKQSTPVLGLQDAVRKIGVLAEDEQPDPALCELAVEGSIQYRNSAYAEAEKLARFDGALQIAHERVENALPSPRFASMLVFLPQVAEARSWSAKLKESTEQIKYLTSEDKESQYCLAMLDVLSEVYFVSDLRAPQGVGALRVGQIENFQVDVDQAQEKLRTIVPPQRFVSQHILMNDFLNDLRLDLRLDLQDTENFARTLDKDYEALQAILIEIGYAAEGLQRLPEQILLYSHTLD